MRIWNDLFASGADARQDDTGFFPGVFSMVMSRRFVPPTALLYSFEAAARHQSFTAAATELSLTQSAVSRHVRALEDQLGADLFVRDRQTVRLNPAGEAYAREIRAALSLVAGATLNFRANPSGGTINLGVLPTLGAQWLAPRLARFHRDHPHVTINLHTRLGPFAFAGETLDAAVHFGVPEWPDADMAHLMDEQLVPVCSPDLAARYSFRAAADLLAAPLLHLISRPDAWERWLAAQGAEADRIRGPLFDQFSFVIAAAIGGAGIALVPRFLVESALQRGDLLQLGPAYRPVDEAYYLVWPLTQAAHAPLSLLRTWLLEETASLRHP